MKKIIILIISIFFGLSVSWADDAIKIACPDGVKANKLLAINKVINSEAYQTILSNEKGKCYKVNFAKFVYLIDESHAVYSVNIDSEAPYYIAPQLFLFEYINSKVKNRQISGVIKGSGEYFNYKDKQGVPRTMPRMIVVKEN